MSQPPTMELLPREDRILLAIQAMKDDKNLKQRRAAKIFNVGESVLRRRRAGQASRRDSQPNSSKLQKTEDEAIIQYTKKLDARGFAPTLGYLRVMANELLAVRDGGQVGENWATNFVRRKPELKSRLSRPRDHQRVLCSDSRVISPWFNLVQNMKAKYGIQNEDIYNFDETGFTMGVAGSVKVVTASERCNRPIGVQPGNREWVTLIAAINALGWAVPPYFIFKAKNHDASWYHDMLPEWRIGLSENGWTTNEVGLAWLKHFIKHTEGRRVGSHLLLIIDGHESHKSLAFQDLCEESKIITLCMPPHASHILQPLDVGCFSPLKRAYGREVICLANSHIEHIDKKAFLASFRQVFEQSFSKENILSSFRATGLVPHDPEVVLSKLEVKPRTPTPPLPGTTEWNPKTPSNAHEIKAQSTLIRDRIKRHKSSSPADILEMLEQFQKGAELMLHSQALLAARVVGLEKANKAASERKARRRKRIQSRGDLSMAEASDLLAQADVEAQLEGERRDSRGRAGAGSTRRRRCKSCNEVGHNSRTCRKDVVDV